MAISRRSFITGVGAAAVVAARGREAWSAADDGTGVDAGFMPDTSGDIILDSNENPLGPGRHVLDAISGILDDDGSGAGRYMFAQQGKTRQAIADTHGVERGNVILGAGSSELLVVATDTYTSRDRPLVTADPTFAACERFARLIGHPVTKVPLDGLLRVDLQSTLKTVEGAGLIYLCNPNNPTATVHSAEDMRGFIEELAGLSSQTTVLIDEAYHDYVTDPAYASMLTLAVKNPRVIVARTFSKAYGMAGLRIGYAISHEDTIKQMTELRGMDMYTNLPGRAGIVAAVESDAYVRQVAERNADVRRFTEDYFRDAGYGVTGSQANFIFVDLRQSGEEFRQACLERGVRIRSGPDRYENYARISLGTMDEMERATEVFASVLG